MAAGTCEDCWNVADDTISRCSAFTSQPLSMKRRGEAVEQLGVRRQPSLAAEVLLGRDDAAAEVHAPDAIDGDARGERIVAAGQPARQPEPVARLVRRETAAGSPACRAATISRGAS